MSIKRDGADIAFSKAVRYRDKVCTHCGTDQTLQCAHIYGRRQKVVRWSMDNAVALCAGCHRYFTENPIPFHDWLLETLGEGHMELLREKTRGHMKTNEALRKEIGKHYRDELKKTESNPEYQIISYN